MPPADVHRVLHGARLGEVTACEVSTVYLFDAISWQ